jgi:hypothetical protein
VPGHPARLALGERLGIASAAMGLVAGDADVRRGLDADVAVVAEIGDLGDGRA